MWIALRLRVPMHVQDKSWATAAARCRRCEEGPVDEDVKSGKRAAAGEPRQRGRIE